jgi:hypothetical protein
VTSDEAFNAVLERARDNRERSLNDEQQDEVRECVKKHWNCGVPPDVCDCTDDEDADADGHYAPGSCCTPADDCDDADPSNFPGNHEICDGVDNDCDGAVDNGLSTDADSDGHYTPGSCFRPDDDCDDTDAKRYPGNPEVCDGVDNDCDDVVDNGLSTDADSDGHYTPGSCFMPDDDCDDTDAERYPGQPEVCDGVDNDCDGVVDDGLSADADSDGHYTPGSCYTPADDCDDERPGRHCADDPPDHRWELGLQAGFFLPDNDLSGKGSGYQQLEPLGGLRVGYRFRNRWAWFADVAYFDINTDLDPERDDAETFLLRSGVERLFEHGDAGRTDWFVAAGLGWAHAELELESPSTIDRAFVSASAGQITKLDTRARLRWELRLDHTVAHDDAFGGSFTTARFLVALTWGLSRR